MVRWQGQGGDVWDIKVYSLRMAGALKEFRVAWRGGEKSVWLPLSRKMGNEQSLEG